jgi:alkylated DNA repair dioxygenase AlkB
VDWDPTKFTQEFNSDKFQVNYLKGRKASFFSRNMEIDYSHNNIHYRRNPWNESLEELARQLPYKFNACLVQAYDKGSSIPYHRDDEACYDKDPIVTVNFGQAVFSFDNGETYELKEGTFIVMKGAHLELKHSVKALEAGRISFTFRLHKRSMNGVPIKSKLLT